MIPDVASRPPRPLKVVVSGSSGAGTSTFISSVSRSVVIPTTRWTAGGATELRSPAPVAMDFGLLAVDRDLVLHLFGTDGPPHQSVQPLLGDRLLGSILLVDGSRDETATGAEAIVEWYRTAAAPYAIGVTNAWSRPEGAVDRVRRRFSVPAEVPVLPVDVRQVTAARSLLLSLFQVVMARVSGGEARSVAALPS
jgi:signal recognition particle receptor subunit beta